MKVLIVEDNVAQVESLQDVLEASGHRCYTALSTASAKVLAEAHPPDIVVLDWILADGGAAEFYLWAKRRGFTVVVTTGLSIRDVMSSVPSDVLVLQKPFGVDELLGIIGRAMP